MLNACSVFARVILLAAAAFAVSPLFAATATFTDRTNWMGTVTPIVNIDFEGVAPLGASTDYYTSTGLTLSGVNFTGLSTASAYELHLVNMPGTSGYNWGSGAILAGAEYYANFQRKIHITLAVPTYAFGVDVMAGSAQGTALTLRVNGTTNYSVSTFAAPTRGFFGITSDTPINTIDVINALNTTPMIDNFTIATAGAQQAPAPGPAETPETSTAVMCATGILLVGLGFCKRAPKK